MKRRDEICVSMHTACDCVYSYVVCDCGHVQIAYKNSRMLHNAQTQAHGFFQSWEHTIRNTSILCSLLESTSDQRYR